MLNILLIISLVVFFIGGYRLMARLDRFLGSNKIVESKNPSTTSVISTAFRIQSLHSQKSTSLTPLTQQRL